ncbi:MAG: ABC transporter ATP-binding protein [Limnochordia bacterium]
MDPIIVIDNLTFTYEGASRPALKGVDLEIWPGEFILLTGPSGCGKSTLALCLNGVIPNGYPGSMEGKVLIGGRQTTSFGPGELAGIIGLVQQDPDSQLCTLKVVDEVAFGPENLCLSPGEINRRVRWALGAVGALHLWDREVYTLSGGEKQRVAIASVLAMTPQVLILDEPTANLDPRGVWEVIDVIERLRREEQTTIIVIEHRLERILPLADRLLVMEEGILQEGSPQRPPVDYPTKPAVPITKEPILKVENLTAEWEGRSLLEDVSFAIHGGEIIAIMGDNGSGKTSLLLSLLGLIQPKQGKITFAEQDITHRKAHDRARLMGLALQNPNHQLFSRTNLEEAALPSRNLRMGGADEGEILDLLGEFELFPERLPFTLSLGEKKRLILVSLLAYRPSVLLLDEPLVGQDDERIRQLLAILYDHAASGGVVLMVCHEVALVNSFDRVLFLEEGRLVIDAPPARAPEQLLARGRREYLGESKCVD